MQKLKIFKLMLLLSLVIAYLTGCDDIQPREPVSSSGVTKTTVRVETDANGHTTEQRNVAMRLEVDNKAGAIKHLYVISPYTGDCILYSTVVGKVTSSGKRLTPTTVVGYGNGQYSNANNNYVEIDGRTYITNELIQDDGTYGSSAEYIYWKDVRGAYHQHFILAGQIIHLSDYPMSWPKIIMNCETQKIKEVVYVKDTIK